MVISRKDHVFLMSKACNCFSFYKLTFVFLLLEIIKSCNSRSHFILHGAPALLSEQFLLMADWGVQSLCIKLSGWESIEKSSSCQIILFSQIPLKHLSSFLDLDLAKYLKPLTDLLPQRRHVNVYIIVKL